MARRIKLPSVYIFLYQEGVLNLTGCIITLCLKKERPQLNAKNLFAASSIYNTDGKVKLASRTIVPHQQNPGLAVPTPLLRKSGPSKALHGCLESC